MGFPAPGSTSRTASWPCRLASKPKPTFIRRVPTVLWIPSINYSVTLGYPIGHTDMSAVTGFEMRARTGRAGQNKANILSDDQALKRLGKKPVLKVCSLGINQDMR